MQDKRILKLFFVFTLLCTLSFVNAQTKNNETQYHINLDLGAGYSYYLTSMNIKNLSSNPFIITGRLMWEPEHLTRLGIEFGYLPLFSLDTKALNSLFGSTDVNLSLNALPLMLVFGIEIYEDLEIFVGLGEFFLFSEVESFDNKVTSFSLSNGYELAASYTHPFYDNLKIGGEIKTFYISRLGNFDVTFQVGMKYNLLSY
ncbi:MAG: hypothetical protein GY936_02290 [Ignavibacteriae bacterium]|nr:hypothetical protein [Ignavibacteriota bacterium]